MAEKMPNRCFSVVLPDGSREIVQANGYNIDRSGALEFYEATFSFKATIETPVAVFASGAWRKIEVAQ